MRRQLSEHEIKDLVSRLDPTTLEFIDKTTESQLKLICEQMKPPLQQDPQRYEYTSRPQQQQHPITQRQHRQVQHEITTTTNITDIQKQIKHTRDYFIITKIGCPRCIKAIQLLDTNDCKYEELNKDHIEEDTLRELQKTYNHKTYPMIFIDGQFFGGCDKLEKRFGPN
jgi:glutaredoxin 3